MSEAAPEAALEDAPEDAPEVPSEPLSVRLARLPLQLNMREDISLRVSVREEQGKGPVGRLRRATMLPGVLYGHQQEALSFKIDTRALERAMSGGGQNAVFLVEFEGADREVERAVVREIQYHKVRGDVLHVDLLRIDPEEMLRISVPLVARGSAAGVLAGGALQQSLATIELECVASELPSSLEIDVTELEVGDSVHVRDLLDKESRILTEADRTVLTVLHPRLIEEDVVEEEAVEGEGVEGEEAEGEGEEVEGAEPDSDEASE